MPSRGVNEINIFILVVPLMLIIIIIGTDILGLDLDLYEGYRTMQRFHSRESFIPCNRDHAAVQSEQKEISGDCPSAASQCS